MSQAKVSERQNSSSKKFTTSFRNSLRPFAGGIRPIAKSTAAIALLALSSSSVCAADATLTWNDNANNEAGFKIERQIFGGYYLQIATVGSNVTTYKDTSLLASTRYWYRVRAYNSYGDSAFSAAVETLTSALPWTPTPAPNPTPTPTPTPKPAPTPAPTPTPTPRPAPTPTPTPTPTPANIAPTISDIADRTIQTNSPASVIAFTVADSATPAASLTLSGTSSNTALLPSSNIVFGGSGNNRTVTIAPLANSTGTATITIRVSDGSLSSVDTFILTVSAANTAPVISPIPNLYTNVGVPVGTAFTVGDAETPAGSLAVFAISSNQSLLPNGSIYLEANGANRALVAVPAPAKSGTTSVTVVASDGKFTGSTSFVLSVGTANTPPTIGPLVNLKLFMNETASSTFTVDDAETGFSSLIVTAGSSNPSLVPDSSIFFEGTGPIRTLIVVPALNQTGVAAVDIKVSDGTLITRKTFLVNVNSR